MRLSDLLGAGVLDEAGRSAGRVHDVRLVQNGAVGARLGYDRGRMKGPLPVKLAGWLRHDGRYVQWGRVRSIEPDRIVISGTVEDLPTPGPSS